MKDVMVDLETFSSRKNASIISIGAVEFDITTGEVGEKFYTNVDWKSNVDMNRHIDMCTIAWWMKQSDEARMALFEEPKKSFAQAILQFGMFFTKCNATCIWSHATFDERILEDAFEACAVNLPWHFRGVRDIRTLMDMLPEDKYKEIFYRSKMSGTHHNALADAEFQVQYCSEAWEYLHGTIQG